MYRGTMKTDTHCCHHGKEKEQFTRKHESYEKAVTEKYKQKHASFHVTYNMSYQCFIVHTYSVTNVGFFDREKMA